MNKLRALLLLAVIAVLPILATQAQASVTRPSVVAPHEQSISGGYMQIDHPWYNYDGTGNVYAGTYAYESFHGHNIEAETCLIYNGVWESCAVQSGDGYTGVYPEAAAYTHGANSWGWQSWSWMYDYTTGQSMSAYSSCCYVYFRAP